MQPLPEIASLWIGERLSILELLCIKSFVDRGHKFTLFSYGELQNPPSYCTVRDAREIWDSPQILRHGPTNNPAIHSDIWRIKLLLQSDMIWVDLDAYCLRPFRKNNGYLFGRAGGKDIYTGVLSLPRESEGLKLIDQFLNSSGQPIPEWAKKKQPPEVLSVDRLDFEKMKWATTGPIVATHFLNQTNEAQFAMPSHVLYPIGQRDIGIVFNKKWKTKQQLRPDTISIHLYGTRIRRRLQGDWPKPDSYLAKLCNDHGIDMTLPDNHPLSN